MPKGQFANRLQNLNVLIVEDSPDDQRLLAALVESAGAEIRLECNGQAAINVVLSEQQHQRTFDVILMDLRMPLMDGGTAAQQLRQNGYTGIIVAVTGETTRYQPEWFLAAGFDGSCGKPVDSRRLFELLECLLAQANSRHIA